MSERTKMVFTPRTARITRLSVTIPIEIYESLEKMARKKKVSLAWVMRDAAERYVADELASSGEVRSA